MHFGGYEIESTYDGSSIVILPVPYDETSTYIRGADKGPEEIAGGNQTRNLLQHCSKNRRCA